jgi:hypothetical protein
MTVMLMDEKVIQKSLAKITDFSTDYIQLCEKIGCQPPKEFQKLKLLKVLRDLGLPIYDYDSVMKHLRGIAKATQRKLQAKERGDKIYTVVTSWHPLRESDLHSGTYTESFVQVNKPYAKPIPFEILKDIEAVVDNFKPGIIAISDFKINVSTPPKLDPFVKVKAYPTHSGFIFGMWDEPGYRIKLDIDKLFPDTK